MIIFSERKLAQYLRVGAVTEKQEVYYLLIANLWMGTAVTKWK